MLISEKMKKNGELSNISLEPNFNGKTMNIELTSMCNENCIYCTYSAQGLHKKRKMIDEKFFYKVTKEAFELGITDIGLYMTAEPLMNPKIYDYVKYLKEIGFKYVYISTNGILCTPKNLEKLAKAGIDSIKFSVSAATQDNFIKHHGVDAFELVKKNIEYAYQYRKDNNLTYKLYMFSIITTQNKEEKELILKTYEHLVDELVFADVLDGIIKLSGLEELLVANKEAQYHAMSARTIPCAQLFNRIVVDEEGYLCTCCFTGNGFTRVMNIINMELKDALYSKEMKKIRNDHINGNLDNTICKRCVTGIVEPMRLFLESDEKKLVEISSIDRIDEIRSRFNI